ncbi:MULTISPECIES: Spy/CpxP family protein refolding chaperone [Nannocystis]|uniref:Spy/CpxP family protein refolding chaperone n=1 Tax=Nannocystis radixulma TaxID=2995305 RepID=A0ABT5BI82_9BACT|nr:MULTISPECIES: Spy/CpxP family protein refolding chaperone [Nannocystis]MCY1056304.1 Spy/CpxP family protein refolding chaperone [Nannocystis sp. SCPEA4]MDC0673214.1 Spy/CpxP family protein refolding chaperone [Nannocystis radixulma]
MHPWFSAWRGFARRVAASRHFGHEHAHCGGFGRGRCGDHDESGGGGDPGGGPEGFFWGGGPFGVRRPLRFLAYKLGLDERQVSELAVILDGLKVERAQAELDLRRTSGGYADLLAAETFDEAAAAQISAERTRSAERVQKAVQVAVGKIHGLLAEEQRRRFVYMLRTGLVRL